MFETHDSWQKQYRLVSNQQYKIWYCVQLKNNRPWFYVKFTQITDCDLSDYIFISDEDALRDFSEIPNLKILEVYLVTSPETNQTFLSQMDLLESIFSACDANNRNINFFIYYLVGGGKIGYPADVYAEDLDDVKLVYTSLDHDPLNFRE